MGKHDDGISAMTWTRMAAFGIFFSSMMLLLNYYVLSHLWVLRVFMPDWAFWPICLLLSFSMVIAWGVTYFSHGRLAQAIHCLAMVWLGFSVMLLFLFIIFDILVLFLDFDTKLVLLAIVVLVVVLTVIGAANAKFTRVVTFELRAKGLKRDLRVVQLSDIHMGVDHGVRFMTGLMDKVNPLRPDLVLITGDLIDGPFKVPDSMFAPLKRLKAPTYLSTGNHEFMVGLDVTGKMAKKVGIRLLRNEGVDLDDGVQLIAVDDAWEGGVQVEEVLTKVRPDPRRYTVLMSHQPRGFEVAAGKGVGLMLSGHTHGGQFFPATLFLRLAYKRGKGLYRSNGSVLYTTTGTGTWGPPIRLGTNSEIVLFDLKAA